MMILPILRLVLIYALLVAGVVAVFNRDKLAPLLPGLGDRDMAAAPEAAAASGAGAQFPPLAQAPSGAAAPTGAAGQGQASGSAPVASGNAAPTPGAPGPLARPAEPGTPVPLGAPVPPAPAAAPGPGTASATASAAAPAAPQAPAAGSAAQSAARAQASEGSAKDTTPAALAAAIGAARSTYWAGDIEGARARMAALVEAHPDNPDLAGELGNLAFALRDYAGAAEAWHRAGLLLIERGESARVMSFLPFLQSIAPDRAAVLAARLPHR